MCVLQDKAALSIQVNNACSFHCTREILARPKPSSVVKPKIGIKKDKRELKPPPVDKPYIPPPMVQVHANSTTKVIKIYNRMTVRQLAQQMGKKEELVQGLLIGQGEVINKVTDSVKIDAAELVAYDLDFNVKRLHFDTAKNEALGLPSSEQKLVPRPAVITVMGHVDHGKTSLLDALRNSSVAATEAGGITQHIGAFVVNMKSGASLTFLDTPGHAAFSAMRARGTAVTDIVVLVVAADDGVMPQTREALSHAQAAHVPMVVAINKCDKHDANPARVREQLAAEGVELEDMGGDVQVVEISATKSMGLEKLEESLLLLAEIMDLKADMSGDVHAVVVEARVDRGRGPLATAIVRNGVLAVGVNVVVGTEWGRVRNLTDAQNQPVKSAGPSMPVEIEGLKGLPQAGDDIIVVASEERARKLSEARKHRLEMQKMQKAMPKPVLQKKSKKELKKSKEEVSGEEGVESNEGEEAEANEEEEEKVELAIIVKADVQGTAEAVSEALKTLTSPQVSISIVHTGVGIVSLSDVDLAEACNACIVCFNTKNMPAPVEAACKRANVDVRHYRVIYHLLEDIGQLIVKKAPGMLEDQVAGKAQVLDLFEIKGKGSQNVGAVTIAGCRVLEGRMMRGCMANVLRSGEVIYEGKLISLKREKIDVDAVGHGNQCGMIIEDFRTFEVGDVIQCIESVRRKPKFVSSESGAVKIEC
ncbi:hypothetical protein KP509_08G043600 [Ceratopteris richardii]|uniref:Translation initiation factor IF-2, mitochondrial n=1 Tax=Ceratopteris richardii TaxID=49495 RepID=A0A8T2U9Z8_CERRI|nr:hypothetical protein KP509_08G043600 [Ceratopteris richardii]